MDTRSGRSASSARAVTTLLLPPGYYYWLPVASCLLPVVSYCCQLPVASCLFSIGLKVCLPLPASVEVRSVQRSRQQPASCSLHLLVCILYLVSAHRRIFVAAARASMQSYYRLI